MPNPVILRDIQARFRPLAENEQENVLALLDDAWAVLTATLPTLDARVASGATSVDVVRAVVVAMALRVLRNPNGVRTWSVDDYSETRDNAVSSGELYVSPEELALLSGSAARRGGAFSVAPPVAVVPAPGAERDAAELAALRYGYLYP